MTIHKPVLLKEALAGLNLKKGAVVVDATLGGGGHAQKILEAIGRTGKLIALDQDQTAIENFQRQLPAKEGNLVLTKGNFSELKSILGGQGIKSVDGILADLGYSSRQLEDASYGLSFSQDAPLDMRLDRDNGLTAKKIINEYSQEKLERILKEYGEEKFYKNIAKKIVAHRKEQPIERTAELAEIVGQAVPERYKHGKIHPATKTFQALRIKVNAELENLEKFIPQAIGVLAPGGRLAIISFHSLEDRIVKNIFRENARGCICPPDFPRCVCGKKPRVKIISKKPVVPDQAEIADNPRARSAKMRVCEKL